MGGWLLTRIKCSTPCSTSAACSPKYGRRAISGMPAPRRIREMKVSLMMRAPVFCAILFARARRSSVKIPFIRITAGFPECNACAAASTPEAFTGCGAIFGSGSAFTSVLFQAVSAGRIRLATCPGGLIDACTASAPSRATSSADSDTLSQPLTGAAIPATSELKGASYLR